MIAKLEIKELKMFFYFHLLVTRQRLTLSYAIYFLNNLGGGNATHANEIAGWANCFMAKGARMSVI